MSETAEKQEFRAVAEFAAVPTDKIDHFCEDLRLWLHMHKLVEAAQADIAAKFGENYRLAVQSQRDVFEWIDDGKHTAKIDVRFIEEPRA